MCQYMVSLVVDVVDGKGILFVYLDFWVCRRAGFLGLQKGWMWMLDRCGRIRIDADTPSNVVAQHVECKRVYVHAHLPGIVPGVLVLVPKHAGHHAADVSNNINSTQGKRA